MVSSQPTPKFKLVFLGDIYTGKTSIICNFMYDSFDTNYQSTVGIDFLSKLMYLGERTIRLQLWDTAGQERFRSLIPNYIRDSSVAVVIFDVTSQSSFESLDKWVDDVVAQRGQQASIVMVGNKIDKEDQRVISKEDAAEKAQRLNAQYIQTSAKTGENIQELFKLIASTLPSQSYKETAREVKNIDIREPQPVASQEEGCKC